MVQEVPESRSAAEECTEEVSLHAYPDLILFPKFVPSVSAGGTMDLWSHLVQLFHVPIHTKCMYVFIPRAFLDLASCISYYATASHLWKGKHVLG